MYYDLDRPPLSDLRGSAFHAPAGWRVTVVGRTGSTNADVVKLACQGEPPGFVLVAEEQAAGRGRLDRTWTSPPRAGLTFSALLSVSPSPWVPLLAGVAVATALRQVCDVDARLKWPNDVLIGEAKVGGILAEVAARAGNPSRVVVGIGINVTTTASELQSGMPDLPHNRPVTSLRLAGASMTDRATILRAILAELGAERSRVEYEALCSTLGAKVTITLPGGGQVTGQATNIDAAGCIVVDGVSYAVGDVVHLR